MRLLSAFLLLPLLAFQAHAQTAAMPQAGPAVAAPPAATAPAVPEHANARHHRMSWKERFAQANSTHDGHLTLEQAKEGYLSVARHFTEIDAGKRGYVTLDDIAAWHKLQRAMHHHGRDQQGQSLRARPAMQHGMAAPQEIKTSTDTKVAPMTQPAGQPDSNDASSTSPRHGT